MAVVLLARFVVGGSFVAASIDILSRFGLVFFHIWSSCVAVYELATVVAHIFVITVEQQVVFGNIFVYPARV